MSIYNKLSAERLAEIQAVKDSGDTATYTVSIHEDTAADSRHRYDVMPARVTRGARSAKQAAEMVSSYVENGEIIRVYKDDVHVAAFTKGALGLVRRSEKKAR